MPILSSDTFKSCLNKGRRYFQDLVIQGSVELEGLLEGLILEDVIFADGLKLLEGTNLSFSWFIRVSGRIVFDPNVAFSAANFIGMDLRSIVFPRSAFLMLETLYDSELSDQQVQQLYNLGRRIRFLGTHFSPAAQKWLSKQRVFDHKIDIHLTQPRLFNFFRPALQQGFIQFHSEQPCELIGVDSANENLIYDFPIRTVSQIQEEGRGVYVHSRIQGADVLASKNLLSLQKLYYARRTYFEGVELPKSILGANFIYNTFTNLLVEGRLWAHVHFNGCQISNTNFSNCHFREVIFTENFFSEVSFQNCRFSNVVFLKALRLNSFNKVQFSNCHFQAVDFRGVAVSQGLDRNLALDQGNQFSVEQVYELALQNMYPSSLNRAERAIVKNYLQLSTPAQWILWPNFLRAFRTQNTRHLRQMPNWFNYIFQRYQRLPWSIRQELWTPFLGMLMANYAMKAREIGLSLREQGMLVLSLLGLVYHQRTLHQSARQIKLLLGSSIFKRSWPWLVLGLYAQLTAGLMGLNYAGAGQEGLRIGDSVLIALSYVPSIIKWGLVTKILLYGFQQIRQTSSHVRNFRASLQENPIRCLTQLLLYGMTGYQLYSHFQPNTPKALETLGPCYPRLHSLSLNVSQEEGALLQWIIPRLPANWSVSVGQTQLISSELLPNWPNCSLALQVGVPLTAALTATFSIPSTWLFIAQLLLYVLSWVLLSNSTPILNLERQATAFWNRQEERLGIRRVTQIGFQADY